MTVHRPPRSDFTSVTFSCVPGARMNSSSPLNAEKLRMPTARAGVTSKSVRLPRLPRNARATPSSDVQEDTPHQVTVRPSGYCARRSSGTPRHSGSVRTGSCDTAENNSRRYGRYGVTWARSGARRAALICR